MFHEECVNFIFFLEKRLLEMNGIFQFQIVLFYWVFEYNPKIEKFRKPEKKRVELKSGKKNYFVIYTIVKNDKTHTFKSKNLSLLEKLPFLLTQNSYVNKSPIVELFQLIEVIEKDLQFLLVFWLNFSFFIG